MNGSERDRLRPPSSATPARRPDAGATRAPARKPEPQRERGKGHDISAVRIHPDDAKTWSKTLDRFAHNSALLTAQHRRAIEALAAEIAARVALTPGAKAEITVNGHTDTSGDEMDNQGLGLERAEAAKAALEAALGRKKVAAERIAGIASESFGETRLAKETPDDVKEPANRRVEITVRIEAPLPGPAAPVAPTPVPQAEEPTKEPIDLNLPRGYKIPEEDWWQRTERERQRIEEYDRKHPRRTRTLTDLLAEGVARALEPVIQKLPKSVRAKARQAIRDGIEAGTEKGCEAAIDASGVTGEEAEALKAACKAALKTKPGGVR